MRLQGAFSQLKMIIKCSYLPSECSLSVSPSPTIFVHCALCAVLTYAALQPSLIAHIMQSIVSSPSLAKPALLLRHALM